MNLITFLEKSDTVLASQSTREQMDAESADMLNALRQQIHPQLMMHAALTPTRIPGHPPPPVAYSLPLSSYMIHVSYSIIYSSKQEIFSYFHLHNVSSENFKS